MNKKITLLLGLLIALAMFSGTAMAQCVVPYEGMTINSDTTFCTGSYYLWTDTTTEAIHVTGSNFILDCNSSDIYGEYHTGWEEGEGFKISDLENVTIKNCIVHDYAHPFMFWNLRNVVFDNIDVYHWGVRGMWGLNNSDITIKNSKFHDKTDRWGASIDFSGGEEDGVMPCEKINNNIYIDNNQFYNVRRGTRFGECAYNSRVTNNVFSGNVISAGTDYGMWHLPEVENINISDNVFTNDVVGLYILTDNTTIERNKFNYGFNPIWGTNSWVGTYFIFADYNEYNENMHNGTPLRGDLVLYFANWNYGCGNVYQYANGTTRDGIILEISSFNNTITTEPCPVPYPEPEWAYTIPKDIIIHVVKQYPVEEPTCVNCEIQHGHQTGVAFYVLNTCEDIDKMCEIWNYYNISDKTKLLTVANDVCADYTLMPNCGTPDNWVAKGKATWVYHNLGNDTQPFLSKYSDELGLSTEFDGKNNKHKIKDDTGVVSESDDIYVADYEISDHYAKFYIDNKNPKTIWTDQIKIHNTFTYEYLQSIDALYTTHGGKKIDLKAEYDPANDYVIITPVKSNQKIPIEPATGSNILELFGNPSSTGFVVGLLPLLVGVGIVLFVVKEGLTGEWDIEKIVALVITIIVAIALLGVLFAMI